MKVKPAILVLAFGLALAATLASRNIDVSEKSTFIEALITAFSIMAGAILAAFGIILGPFRNAPWQRLENNRSGILNDVILFKSLFVFYLFALILVLADLLFSSSLPIFAHAIQCCYIFLGTFTLVYSLYLPFKIAAMIVGDIDNSIALGRSSPPPSNP